MPERVASLVGDLDLRSPAAEAYLRERLPDRLVGVGLESQEAVQRALIRGMEEGRDGLAIAREVREVVGLTGEMEGYVANLRRQLETGEVAGQTPPWMRRLSAAEQAQARRLFRETVSSPAEIDALVERYSESLRNRRAQNIARNEIHDAYIHGQQATWEQAASDGFLEPDRTRRQWLPVGDERTRDEHAQVPGLNPGGVALGEPFKIPGGVAMGPGQSGRPSFDINCRCTVVLEIEDD